MHIITRFKPVLRRLARHVVAFEYLGLAVLVMLPLLRPGYILAFDMAWGPVRPSVPFGSNTWLLNSLISALSQVVPGWLVQKALLLAIITLAGWGAHRLIRLCAPKRLHAVAYAAGLLFVLNPFFYTRFVTGQWLVMAGYALLPWAVAALYRLALRPSWRMAWPVAVWIGAIGLTSIHTFAIMLVVAPVLLLACCKQVTKPLFAWAAAAAGGVLLINMAWLVAGFATVQNRVDGFTGQLDSFASQGSIAGNPALSLLTLQGFWADVQQRYVLPSQGGWWWPMAACFLSVVVVWGMYAIVRQRDRLGITLLLLGMVAFFASLGVSWQGTRGITEWMVANVPLYAGFREPQKWLMLLALAYAYSFAVGVGSIYLRVIHRYRQPAIAATLLLPVVFGGIMLFGASGQLRAAHYPEGWHQAEQYIAAHQPDHPVLVLPWHMYMPVSFAGRTVANPARQYFTIPLLTGNDPEIRGVTAENRGKLTNRAADYALRRDETALKALQGSDVRYILLLKEADWRRYGWLDAQPGLRRVLDTPTTRLYEISP